MVETKEVFARLKEHLNKLPRLVILLPREELYMYLALSDYSVNAVLLAERDEMQILVYFVGHVLKNAEL